MQNFAIKNDDVIHSCHVNVVCHGSDLPQRLMRF